jgi:hypothetical protein
VADLESLKAITALSLLSDNIENSVDKLGTLGVMTLGPVVTGTGLSEDEVVWTEELSEWSSADGVHGSWLQVHEDGAWDISSTSGLIVIDVDALKLEVRISVI